MRNRLRHTIIPVLLILLVSLGTSLAGSPVCFSGGPECGVIPACCADMADNSGCGTSGTTAPLPGSKGCSHDGICRNSFQPVEVFAAIGTLEYDSALLQSHLSSEIHLDLLCKPAALVILKSSLEKLLPLYLRNCSFLI